MPGVLDYLLRELLQEVAWQTVQGGSRAFWGGQFSLGRVVLLELDISRKLDVDLTLHKNPKQESMGQLNEN